MSDTLVPAQSFFDTNFGIRNHDLEKVIAAAIGKKADYADLFFEYRRNEGVSLEEGMVKNCSQSTSNGVGVRVLAEAKTGYAYTDDITIEKLEIAARTALELATDIDPSVGVVTGDTRRLGQALENILRNSLNYTDEGGRVLFRREAV